jgi:hypothetical protein
MTTDLRPAPVVAALLSALVRRGASVVRRGGVFLLDAPGVKSTRTVIPDAPLTAMVSSDGLRWRVNEAGAMALRRGAARGDGASVDTSRRRSSRTSGASTASLHMLDRLRGLRDAKGRPVLTGAQAEAGLRLAADFIAGGMQPRVTLDWSFSDLGTARPRGHPTAAQDVNDRAEAARNRMRRALDDVGPEFNDLLMDVCCFETPLEVIEKRRGWPARSARLVLSLGLDRLARHYGTVSEVPARRSAISVWTAPSQDDG